MEFMATSGGPHPPEHWAAITATQIIQVTSGAVGKQADEARDLRERMIEILARVHRAVQEHERAKLAEHGVARLDHPFDPSEHIDSALADILAATERTSFRDYFAQAYVQNNLRETLGQHFATSMDIERKWHALRQRH